jgi:hypothetical protein
MIDAGVAVHAITTTSARAILDASMTEKRWMQQLIDTARLCGWYPVHQLWPMGTAHGVPDLVLIRERVVWIEAKTERGKLTPAQAAMIDRLRAAGQEVHVWRPSDWPTVERMLAGRPCTVSSEDVAPSGR